jgi:type I restriction enzyme, S subunit
MSTKAQEIATKANACEHANEWREAPLGDFLRRVVGGGTPSRAVDSYWRGEIPWASVKDLKEDTQFLIDTEEHISPAGLAKSAANLIEAGIPVVSTRMAVGRAVRFRRPMAINQDLKALYPNDKLEPAFLVLLLGHIRRQLESLSIGSTVKGIGVDQLLGVRVKVPARHQQSDIVKVIETVDSAIEQATALVAKLTEMKQGLMQDLLTRGIDENGNPRSEKTHKFKDSLFGRIPDEWSVTDCNSVCREIVVGIVIRPTQYYVEDGVPALRSANVREGYLDGSELVYISEKSNRKLSKSIIREGDVLTVRTGYPGSSCVVTKQFDGANCIDVIISRPGQRVNPHFLALWINSAWGKGQILQGQGGLAQQHFNVTELKKVAIPVPKKEEQGKIIEVVVTNERLVKAGEDHKRKLQALKRGLMEDLLSGKVRLSQVVNQ